MNVRKIFQRIVAFLLIFLTTGCSNQSNSYSLFSSTGSISGEQELWSEGYDEHPFLSADKEPVSTFSVDVDTASYTHARAQILSGVLPDPHLIRSEEFTNYFRYPGTEPKDFVNALAMSYEVGPVPWMPEHRLLKAIIKAKDIPMAEVPPLNLTFLIDVSGSMN